MVHTKSWYAKGEGFGFGGLGFSLLVNMAYPFVY